MPKSFRFLGYNLAFCLIVGTTIFAVWQTFPSAVGGEYVDSIDDFQKTSIATMNEMNKFLASIAFIVLGVMGNILIGKTKFNEQPNFFSTVLFFGAILGALISIFYSYLGYSKLFELINNHIPDFSNRQLKTAKSMQFYSLFVSVIFFSWYIFSGYVLQRTTDAINPDISK